MAKILTVSESGYQAVPGMYTSVGGLRVRASPRMNSLSKPWLSPRQVTWFTARTNDDKRFL